MLFHSVTFILLFLPISFLLYYIVPDSWKNRVLLLESLVFYAFGNLKYLPLALGLVLIDYLFAHAFKRISRTSRCRRALLVTSLVVNVLLLLAFKYGSYLTWVLNRITHGDITFFDVLPLGISYYLFKLISYLCDVYQEKCEPEKNFIDFAVYVLMYPQMIVGPIIRYTDIRDDLKNPKQRRNPECCLQGIRMFVYGLAKKVILADTLGRLWEALAGTEGIGLAQASSGLVWLAVLAYSLQLYLDFSGYSEMSNGLSCLLGFSCKKNFDYPYLAGSVTEFWRRWHITLSEWFRDYVYIPLGGNRKGAVRQIFNMLVVWLLTGIWHGHTANFLVWGLYYFIFLVLEKYVLQKGLKRYPVLGHIYTLLVAVTGWGIFAADGAQITFVALLHKMFCFSDGVSALYFLRNYGVTLLLSMAVSGGCCRKIQRRLERNRWVEAVWLILLFLISFAYVVGSTGRAALYAGF